MGAVDVVEIVDVLLGAGDLGTNKPAKTTTTNNIQGHRHSIVTKNQNNKKMYLSFSTNGKY